MSTTPPPLSTSSYTISQQDLKDPGLYRLNQALSSLNGRVTQINTEVTSLDTSVAQLETSVGDLTTAGTAKSGPGPGVYVVGAKITSGGHEGKITLDAQGRITAIQQAT